jgi:integrase
MASFTQQKTGWRAHVYVSGQRDTRVFRTQREAKAWAAARELELRAQKDKKPAERHTVAEMLRRYGEEVSITKRGARAEQLRLAAFVRDFPTLAELTLAEFKTPHLAQWRDARLKDREGPDGKTIKKVSPAAVSRDINLIRNAFKIAREEWHWMEHNPFKGFRLPPEAAPRTRRISWREVKTIVRWLGHRPGVAPVSKSQEVALAFLVALRSAMRVSEILSLGRGTLDMKKRVATVSHKMEYLTGKPRQVPLTRQAIRLLRPVAERERCFTVTADSLDALFRKAKKSIGIADLHFHDSRAEALTRLSRRVDVMTLAKISGHKDLRILQEVYYRESPEDIAARL